MDDGRVFDRLFGPSEPPSDPLCPEVGGLPPGASLLPHRVPARSASETTRLAGAEEMYTLLQSCLAYFDNMKHARVHCDNNDHDRTCSGALFAPDPEWIAPIRTLLTRVTKRL